MQEKITQLHKKRVRGKWDRAITDAKAKINQHRRRIRSLQKAIQFFKDSIRNNEPWPGETFKG
jgi:uncharacterized protein YeeX (DUF496 family)